MISQEQEEDYESVLASINDLVRLEKQDVEMVQAMKQIVTEYKSLNSVYEHLDN